jgi:hypothetical protein
MEVVEAAGESAFTAERPPQRRTTPHCICIDECLQNEELRMSKVSSTGVKNVYEMAPSSTGEARYKVRFRWGGKERTLYYGGDFEYACALAREADQLRERTGGRGPIPARLIPPKKCGVDHYVTKNKE